MNIELKRNNLPTEAGYYLCRRFPNEPIEMVEVQEKGRRLWMSYYAGTWTGGISRRFCEFGGFLKHSVWSERLHVRTQNACEVDKSGEK